MSLWAEELSLWHLVLLRERADKEVTKASLRWSRAVGAEEGTTASDLGHCNDKEVRSRGNTSAQGDAEHSVGCTDF